jgi:hypothetical protein
VSQAPHTGGEPPRDDEPGGRSTPRDTDGGGPVSLEDRTGAEGAPAANQAKSEPIPPTQGHPDPTAPLQPPPLDAMNVDVNDPQRPSLGAPRPTGPSGPGDAPRDLGGPGAPPAAERPVPDTATATGTDLGPENPVSTSAGESHRAPGLQGVPSSAEEVETDVEASAGGMVPDTGRPAGAGDAQGVPVPPGTASAGTSEEHGAVQGARIPASDDSPG